jgi:ADP-ribose pyrophosphatase YjhB (NUDIX family)
MSEPLFNANPNKIIEVFDLLGKKHKRNLKNFKFRVSCYGVLKRKDELLVQRHPKLESYGLPGGGVEIGESLKNCLIREFKEETGLKIKIGQLLTVTEDLFTYEGEDSQSVLITYEVSRVGGTMLQDGNHGDTGEVKYIKLSMLNKHSIQRVFWPIIKKLKNNQNMMF